MVMRTHSITYSVMGTLNQVETYHHKVVRTSTHLSKSKTIHLKS
jgi:hypothetical protein